MNKETWEPTPYRVPLDLLKMLKGGPGSGNFGHSGRPGTEGGSGPGGGSPEKHPMAGLVGDLKAPIPLDSKARRSINSFLHDLGTRPQDGIPVNQIQAKLASHGLKFQEDFLLTGRDGRDHFPLETTTGAPIKNSELIMNWHKYDSGRYEITAYLS